MTDIHYPSPAIATSNSQVAVAGASSAPAIRGETDGGVGPILGRWSTRFETSLAA